MNTPSGSLVKGVGDGEPIASERFTVGGHEWVRREAHSHADRSLDTFAAMALVVPGPIPPFSTLPPAQILLFYPDGKRSQSDDGQLTPVTTRTTPPCWATAARRRAWVRGPGQPHGRGRPHGAGALGRARRAPHAATPARGCRARRPGPPADHAAGPGAAGPGGLGVLGAAHDGGGRDRGAGDDPGALGEAEAPTPRAGGGAGARRAAASPAAVHPMPYPPTAAAAPAPAAAPGNEYCALFVALIGEGEAPQGVWSTGEGVWCAPSTASRWWTRRGGDVSKGRRRDQARSRSPVPRADPQARNCHGYRKFVKRSVLEDLGAACWWATPLSSATTSSWWCPRAARWHARARRRAAAWSCPRPSLGPELACLLDSGEGADGR